MTKTLVSLVLAVVLVLALAGAASAQYTAGDKQGRFGIGFGLYYPIDSKLRSGDRWLNIKATYALSQDEEKRAKSYVGLQYIAPTSGFNGTRMIPITYNKVFRKNAEDGKSFYLTTGAGLHLLQVEHYDFLKGEMTKYTGTKFGLVVGAGVEFSPSSKLELTYSIIQDLDDTYPVIATQSGDIGRMGFSFNGLALTYYLGTF